MAVVFPVLKSNYQFILDGELRTKMLASLGKALSPDV
jgi:hypothetical protein